MIEARCTIESRSGARTTIDLTGYLDPAAEERAHVDAYRWIKALRDVQVDSRPFRDRFTVRGDSLWWFTELYLHKERAVLDVFRGIAAAQAMVERESPAALHLQSDSALLRHVVSQVAAAHGVRTDDAPREEHWQSRLARLNRRARWLTLHANATPSRLKRARVERHPRVAAFIHRAFWKSGGEDGSAETYIGPVLAELERMLGAAALAYVGVGPAVNFRSRRMWARALAESSVVPIERYAPFSALADSRAVWQARSESFETVISTEGFRAAARIGGIDCWPIVREQLAGIAWLQWPWSARAMDEAAAALDALQPGCVVTYAEAGGWGRALILEARRRGIPSVGLQHGFIYRHWLNYLHEPDEMSGTGQHTFPRPTRTLLFDEYAAEHLRQSGHFPAESLRVTGSQRLDDLARAARAVTGEAIAALRASLGLKDADALVLVTTKEREARPYLDGLAAAAHSLPDVAMVIKPHPAETRAAYEGLASRGPHVRIVDVEAPLALLLMAARAVVTVNSTVALDAGVLGVPALTMGLPNNLSPFVEGGAIAGTSMDDLSIALRRILYDDEFRQQLAARREDLFGPRALGTDGRAAARAAAAIGDLIGHGELATGM